MKAPSLPPELWDLIFAFAAENDTVHLWTEGRQTSKTWDAAICRVYRDLFLRNASRFTIHFDPDEVFEPEPGYGQTSFELEMVFDRFEEDKTRSVFSESLRTKQRTWSKEAYREMFETTKTARWRSRVLLFLGPYEEAREDGGEFYVPAHTIRLCRHEKHDCCNASRAEKCIVNDSELPHLEVDFDKREISFDWIAMFTALFSEEAELRKRHAATVTPFPDNDLRKARTSELLQETFDQASQAEWQRREIIKFVRRERVERYYRQRFGRTFTEGDWNDIAEPEMDALDKIVRRESSSDHVNYSQVLQPIRNPSRQGAA